MSAEAPDGGAARFAPLEGVLVVALEQVVSRAKTLDMEEVRREMAKQEGEGATAQPPAA